MTQRINRENRVADKNILRVNNMLKAKLALLLPRDIVKRPLAFKD